MRLYPLLAILALLLLAGCVPVAKEPFYTPGDLVFEKALIGDYMQGPEQTVFLKRGEGKSYLYGPADKEKDARPAYLIKLGDYYFMDQEMPGQGQHFFYKVGVVGQEVRVWVMSVPWLKAVVEKDPKAIAYEIKKEVTKENGKEVVHEQFIFTGPTKDMQAFVLRYIDTPEAWVGPVSYQAKFDMPIKAHGLMSKKQQTFECWYEFRTIVGKLAADPMADPVKVVDKAAADLGSLSGKGIDPEAIAVVKEASKTLEGMAEKIRKGEEARPLIKAFVKEMAVPAGKTAGKLSDRYSMKFGVIN
jgi:hypothetical protein